MDQLAAFVIKREGFDPGDQETVKTIRQRCTVALDRCYDKGQVIANKISRGGFTAAFLLQCFAAIGSQNVRLDELPQGAQPQTI